MTEPTDTSARRKPGQSLTPGQLTPQEIELLKQDARQAGEKLHELWKEHPINQQEDD